MWSGHRLRPATAEPAPTQQAHCPATGSGESTNQLLWAPRLPTAGEAAELQSESRVAPPPVGLRQARPSRSSFPLARVGQENRCRENSTARPGVLAPQVSRDSFHSALITHTRADIRPLSRPHSKSSHPRFFLPYLASIRLAASIAFLRTGFCCFFAFPKAQWKTLRTTNTIERLHEEFRRRVKTQGSLPSEDAAVVLLFSLVATGQIKLRRIDGWQKIATVLSQNTLVAA